jgi:glycosyltransferase involved in cell wall biosynthesis
VLASAPAANAADVILSTVDTVGIPAVLLHRWQRLRRPLVYVAIGLPERLELLRSSAARRLYRGAFRRAQAIVTHGWAEKEALRMWLGAGGPRVSFVPFGVDVDAFRPLEGAEPDVDVVSIGADPRRDFALLVGVARRNPERSFRIIASAEHARTLSDVPRNVAVEVELPFALIHERLARARVVALPVRDNTYSGATTVLLQALATGRPVVVSRTGAIERGYGLVDRDTCRLVPPGDAGALESALLELLDDQEGAEAMGARARETAVRELSWSRYVEALAGLLAEAAGGVPA